LETENEPQGDPLPRDFPVGPAEIIVLAAPPDEGTHKRDSGKLLKALESLRSMERTEEEERVLEDFDRFQQAHPFDLASRADKPDEAMEGLPRRGLCW
jgi:hypothetical protein